MWRKNKYSANLEINLLASELLLFKGHVNCTAEQHALMKPGDAVLRCCPQFKTQADSLYRKTSNKVNKELVVH